MTQSTIAVRRAVKAYLDTICSGGYGDPGNDEPNDVYMIGQSRQPTRRPTTGTARSREREIELDVTFSCFRFGGTEVQQAADEAAQRYGEQLEAQLRTVDNTLGGACRDSWVSNIVLDPLIGWATEDGDANLVPSGRIGQATVTVTALVRF